MLKGDISNQAAPTLAIRVENVIIEPVEKSLVNKVFSKLGVREVEYRLRDGIVEWFEEMFLKTSNNIVLVVAKGNDNREIRKLLERLSFTRLDVIEKPTEIAHSLLVGLYMYYIDNDIDIVNRVGKNAMTEKQAAEKGVLRAWKK